MKTPVELSDAMPIWSTSTKTMIELGLTNAGLVEIQVTNSYGFEQYTLEHDAATDLGLALLVAAAKARKAGAL